jgi:HEAT repeat protein
MALRIRTSVQFLFCVLALCVWAVAENPSKAATAIPSNPDLQERAWKILRGGLEETKASRRVEAVKALSLLSGHRLAIKLSLSALHDKDPKVRASAASTLGQLHASSAVPALKEALSDEDISVMLAATYALFLLKDPSAYDIYYAILMGDKKASKGLIKAQVDRLKNPKQVAELGFEEGLGFVPFGGMGYEAYRTIAKHDSSPVRAAAARFLASDPDPISQDALIQAALADKEEIVRQAALDALAQKGDASCIERLSKNLDDDKHSIRYRTAATIIHLSGSKRKRPKTN